VENLVTSNLWPGRRILITGHTGFKGSWLALWLSELGAEVTGFALAPPTTPSLFDAANISRNIRHITGDVRDIDAIRSAVHTAKPEIVFHLAAQPIVRYSYQEPVETYATNVMGTVHVLEACREVEGVRAIVAVTSDKCYENREWVWPYRENDPMGGYDPYSSSKGAAELVISAYRRSFFSAGTGLASVRAGNVIGGGDWASDRLIPDLIRAFEAGKRPDIRSPQSVRPWQHVLEALGGYLMIAEKLYNGDMSIATGWNFGPSDDDAKPVSWIVQNMLAKWGDGAPDGWDAPTGDQPHEAHLLRLDCSKARTELGWRPALCLDEALQLVVEWHRAVHAGGDAREISLAQLAHYRQSLLKSVPEFTA
jgi:CDP-glucose 4,6-dehydratase